VTEPDRRVWQEGLQGADKIAFQMFPKLSHLMIAGEQPSRPAEYQIPGTWPAR
jgi:hypothetical protein